MRGRGGGPGPAALLLLLLALAAGPASGKASGAAESGEEGAAVEWSKSVGREVTVEGRRSRLPWQHMTTVVAGKTPQYLDLDGGGQVVAYVASALPEGRRLRLTGTVLRVEGGSKRPGARDDTVLVEHQLDVSRVEVAEAPEAVETLLERLTDPELSFEEKRELHERIVARGREALAVLVAHLADTRFCGSERAFFDPEPLPGQGAAPAPVRDRPLPVGAVCRRLLYRIVTPDTDPPPSPRARRWPFEIPDAPAWWEHRRDWPLDRIREELRPVLERHRATGAVQTVR